MFLASSEIAVAMSVASPEENPISLAIRRPFWRAETISWSDLIANLDFPNRHDGSLSVRGFELFVQVRQAFFQV